MITFDPAKDAANIAKHGVSLAMASDLEVIIVRQDTRRAYGEDRFNAYGHINGKLYALTFTVRGPDLRAISLRRCRTEDVPG